MPGTAISPAIVPVGATGRKTRRPSHEFYVRSRPFQLFPIMIAPVLPGETLKNLLVQARVITDPVANPLIGWWKEYYFFYVKHRDLDDRSEFEQMMLNPEWTKANVDDAVAHPDWNFRAGNIDWLAKCTKRVTEEFFRNEGEAWNNVTIDGHPVVAINSETWLQSAALADDVADPTIINEGGATTHEASELDAAFRQWEYMRGNDLTQMSYEDFLKTYGVRTSRIEQHKPELIRYVRQWQYPSSVVSTVDGVPQSAVSWAISERGDKGRFFIEPGFIVGYTVTRPKVYVQTAGYAAQYMDRFLDWLPAVLREDVYSSLKKYANGVGPVPQVTDSNGYWLDIRDLYMHGDQFYSVGTTLIENQVVSTANYPNVVDLPTAGMNVEYPDIDDANGLFLYASGSRTFIREDGIVSLNILGTQQDYT